MSFIHDWPMDEGTGTSIADIEGSATGDVYNSTWTSITEARGGEAYTCTSSSNGFVSIPHQSSFNFDGSYTIYVEGQYASTSNTRQTWLAKFLPDYTDDNVQYSIFYDVGADEFVFEHRGTDSTTYTINTGVSGTDGDYYRLAMRYDADATEIAGWINGSAAGTTTGVAGLNHTTDDLVAGRDNYRGGGYTEGEIGCLALANSAGTDSQMSELTTSGPAAVKGSFGSNPSTADGNAVTGLTADGNAVYEVTVDGDVVWTS